MAGEMDFSAYRQRIADACQMIVNAPVALYTLTNSKHLPFWLIDIKVTRISRQNFRTFLYTVTADLTLVRAKINNVYSDETIAQIEVDMESIMGYWQDKVDFRTTNYPASPAGFYGMVQLTQISVSELGIVNDNGQWIGAHAQLTWQQYVTKNAELT